MLLASGVGSFMSQSTTRTHGRWWAAIAGIVVVCAAYSFLLPSLLASLVGLGMGTKLLLSGLLIAPLALLMGMPFPTGLSALGLMPHGSIEWAWALNAAASVLGSALAIMIALELGLTAVLLSAAGAYVLSAALSGRFSNRGAVFEDNS